VNIPRVVFASARADFLERIRRYSFLFTLGLALYFGYLAAVGQLMLRIGEFRGIYNSAWIGALLAMVGSTFISLAGFYFVKNTIQRDRETRVGEILASTPLSKLLYILSKFLSNFAVLSLMILVLALAAIVMQLARGEDLHIHLGKLFAPLLLLAIPAVAVIAALAVTFETIPFLRGGFGNVAYFFLWIAMLATPVATRSLTFDLSGLSVIRESMIAASGLPLENTGFSFSLQVGALRAPAPTFRWEGVSWTSDILLSRLALFGVALILSFLASLFFDRFDPARRYRPSAASPGPTVAAAVSAPSAAAASPVRTLTPLPVSAIHSRFLTILSAEIRLLLKGQRWWWYLITAGFIIACAAVPDPSARGMLLGCAWIWPILLWSSMGHSRSTAPDTSTSFLRASPYLASTPCRVARGSVPRRSHRQRIRSAPSAGRPLARPVCLADRRAIHSHLGPRSWRLERLRQALRNPLYPVVVSRPHARLRRPRLPRLCSGHILHTLSTILPRAHRRLRRSRATRPQTPAPRVNLRIVANSVRVILAAQLSLLRGHRCVVTAA
jgi:hypothetical protein